MEDGTIMVNVSLARYENGIRAMARIEALKAFTIKSDYNISREDIASILGFELPREVEKGE
jgi:hypothetical protein